MKAKQKTQYSLRPAPGFFPTLLKAIAIVMVWRGVWNLLDMYFLPDQELLGNVICMAIGIFLLYLPDKSIKELV